MRLTYFGHASFLVETKDKTRVILDPYRHGAFDGGIRHEPIGEAADVVVASHAHDDHNATDTILGHPVVLLHPKTATSGALQITGIDVAHDKTGGSKRGRSTIMILDDGDIRLVHLGDLGHTLDEPTVKAIGRVDVLLIPVGGLFTIDGNEAVMVVDSLNPRIVVPMHYKTDRVGLPIATVEPFLATQSNVERKGTSTLEVTQGTLPAERVTMVLTYSR